MTQADQTANPTDARQASMSRVSTQETILAKLNPQEPAKEATEVQKTDGEHDKDGEQKPKKGPAERIQELIAKRKEAEDKASEAERRAAELEARVQALQAQAKPLEVDARPNRAQFTTDDEYHEAVGEWKAKKIIAEREQQQAQARAEAEQAEIAAKWSKRQEAVMKTLPDYAEVIGKTEVQVPEYVHQALLESEQGPQIAYYLALHPDEAKRIASMKPVAAIKRVAALERDLAEIDAEDDALAQVTHQVQKSKAPPPIEPVRSSPSSSGSGQTDYSTYKARRKAEQRN